MIKKKSSQKNIINSKIKSSLIHLFENLTILPKPGLLVLIGFG